MLSRLSICIKRIGVHPIVGLKAFNSTKPAMNSYRNFENSELFKSFNEDVLTWDKLKNYLSKKTMDEFIDMRSGRVKLTPMLADRVAVGMKTWAIERGATHYSHWFQPMNDTTAEKHESFLESEDGVPILSFGGKTLTAIESDGSSLPSGGLRRTAAARGYSVWDTSSPSFLKGKTLMIPASFLSWTGEVLDLRTNLLRSEAKVAQEAISFCKAIGVPSPKTINATVGIEQEFFLIPRDIYMKRNDLRSIGRTLFGAPSIVGQRLSNHYMRPIPNKVMSYMRDVENQMWRLGCPLKIKHSQYEFAPIYESLPIASDHNVVLMNILQETAEKHDLACLLHEKPFAGINGSGKHDNWSLRTDNGEFLFDPGKTPDKRLRFFGFLAALVKAFDTYGDVLRASIACPGNDHRLGACEAPPAIFSIYLGGEVDYALKKYLGGDNSFPIQPEEEMPNPFYYLAHFKRPLSDRNRTSPFAFCGNRFEFRTVGSTQDVATPTTYLNTIFARALMELREEIEGSNSKDKVHSVLRNCFKRHERIIFNGDNYSNEWIDEANKRGLSNIRWGVEALRIYNDPKTIKLFEDTNVIKPNELSSQHQIALENFINHIGIEIGVMKDLVNTEILPAAFKTQELVAKSIAFTASPHTMNEPLDTDKQKDLLSKITILINDIMKKIDNIPVEETSGHNEVIDTTKLQEKAEKFCIPAQEWLQDIRESIDALELLTSREHWPFPRYGETLVL